MSASPLRSSRAALPAWLTYTVIALALALVGLRAWLGLVIDGGPALYGEGAVANAAILLREGALYRPTDTFVAANYPPLYFALAAIGDPFVSGRMVSIAATLAVAAMAYVLARPAGRLAAVALGLGWLALAPVLIWGPAIKPDPLAVALTAGAAFALTRSTRNAPLAALLLAGAIAAKPTALLPAIALAVWCVRADAPAARRALPAAGLATALGAAVVLAFGPVDVYRHVVRFNALPWSLEQAVLLALVGVVVVGVVVGAAFVARAWRGPIAAYGLGALSIVVLGGREGATINYLLDLAAAATLALASAAPRLRSGVVFPVAATIQIALGVALLNPLGVLPGRPSTTGAWGDPARLLQMRALLAADAGRARSIAPLTRSVRFAPYLVEDSGLLVALGARPLVDDLFLYSRLVDAGVEKSATVVERIVAGELVGVVSEVDLARISDAPAYERQRWHPRIVAEVLGHFTPAPRTGPLFVYR